MQSKMAKPGKRSAMAVASSDNGDMKRRNVATPSKHVPGAVSPSKPSNVATPSSQKSPMIKAFQKPSSPDTKNSKTVATPSKDHKTPDKGSLSSQNSVDKVVHCKSTDKTVSATDKMSSPSSQPSKPNSKVCGPEFIQTLRGKILGREVAVICCGEAHERALDLTRTKGIIEATRGWVPVPNSRAPGFDPSDARRKQAGVTFEEAKNWAVKIMTFYEDELNDDGVHLLYLPKEGSEGPGVAYYFGLTQQARKPRGSTCPVNAVMLKWFDLDEDVRADVERMKATCADGTTGRPFREKTHDATIAKRKEIRRAEGLELFDDWLLRCYQETEGNKKSKIKMHFVHEHSVPFSELELHVEKGVSATPPAHECLRAMELDSDSDSAEERNPDDGCGDFADYLTRRVEDNFAPDRIHGVDPRNLGDPPDGDKSVGLLKNIQNFQPTPKDAEEVMLSRMRAVYPKAFAKKHGYTADILPRRLRNRMPS